MHNALFFAAPDFPSLVSEAWDPPTKDRAEEGIKYLGLFHVLCYWDPYCSYELAYVSPTLSSAADRPTNPSCCPLPALPLSAPGGLWLS